MVQHRSKSGDLDSVERWTSVRVLILVLVIVAILVVLGSVVYKARVNLSPIEYEGKVIEKWAGYTHSDEGSLPYFRLSIEKKDGQRLTVAVDHETYDRAIVGMWIKKTPKGIELSRLKRPESEGLT